MAVNASRYRPLFLLAPLVGVTAICLGPASGGSFDLTPLQWSPDGRYLVLTTDTGETPQGLAALLSPKPSVHKTRGRASSNEIWLLRSDGSRLRRVSRRDGLARWVGDKHLLLGPEVLPAKGGAEWTLLDLHGKRVARIVSEAPEVLAWEVSPDGRYLAYVGSWPHEDAFECALLLYQFTDRRPLERYDLTDDISWSIGWSPDSRYVYVEPDWRLDVVGRRLERKRLERRGVFGSMSDFAVNDAGQIVAAVSGPGLTSVDWETGAEELIAKGNFGAVAFGRDPRVFICGEWKGDAQTVETWIGRLCDGAWQLSQLEGVRAPGAIIALSRDSRRLAYEAPDGNVKVRNIPRASGN